jgi:hypothetical protein
VGAGFSLPHVEATYLGNTVSAYEYGGPAVQAGAGVELVVYGSVMAIVDGRVTYTKVSAAVAGATLSAPFTTWHLAVGAGWRFR